MRPLGNGEVEARIVDEDKDIGAVFGNILAAEGEILLNLAEMSEDIPDAHDGRIAIMPYERPPDGRHKVAAPKTELGIRIFGNEGLHEI